MGKHEDSDEIVRYEKTDEEEEEIVQSEFEQEFIDNFYDNLDNSNIDNDNNSPEPNLPSKQDTKADTKFNSKFISSFLTSNNPVNKLSGIDIRNANANMHTPYTSNFTKVTDNLNINFDSEVVNFEDTTVQKRINKIIDDKEMNIFSQEELICSTKNFQIPSAKVKEPSKLPIETKLVSNNDLINKYNEIKQRNNKTKDHPVQQLPNKNNFDKDKYKVFQVINSDEDLDIELQCESEHIIDFQKSTYAKDILIPNEMEKDLEMQYIKKLKSLQEENKNLKSKMNLKEDQEKEGSNNKIVSQIDEVHILTKKLDEIRLENEQLKNKDTQNKTILLEKERNYTTLKSEFSKKDEKINNLTEESRNLKSQIENMKQEFDNLRSELSKKSNKISELQQAYFHLEQENTELKSKSIWEQKTLRDTKQSYETTKLDYLELKNNYEVLSIKFQNINDANISLKKELITLENKLKNKSDKLIRCNSEVEGYDIIENPHKPKPSSSNCIGLKQATKPHLVSSMNEVFNVDNTTSSICLSQSSTRGSLTYNEVIPKRNMKGTDSKIESKPNHSFTTMNVFPSQKEMLEKESKILEIETKLYALQQTKEKISGEFARLPEFPKQKAQILKKKNLEITISEYNQNINKLKQELRSMNALNRDY